MLRKIKERAGLYASDEPERDVAGALAEEYPVFATNAVAVPSADPETELGIEDYDELVVEEILPLLPELYDDELEAVRNHERETKGRAKILNRISKLLGEIEDEAGDWIHRSDPDPYTGIRQDEDLSVRVRTGSSIKGRLTGRIMDSTYAIQAILITDETSTFVIPWHAVEYVRMDETEWMDDDETEDEDGSS